jgi:hypothetical protein
VLAELIQFATMADQPNAAPAGNRVKGREMTLNERRQLFMILHTQLEQGSLPRGALTKASRHFPNAARACSVIWKTVRSRVDEWLITKNKTIDYQEAAANPLLQFIDMSSLPDELFAKGDRVGRPMKFDRQEMMADVLDIPPKDRSTYRQLSAALGISVTTLHRMAKQEKIFKVDSNKVKPALKEANKHERVAYVLDQVDATTRNSRTGAKYLDMMDRVHVDEKWFLLCKLKQNFILLFDEEPPKRFVRHKSHVEKVMFLVAQARPRWIRPGEYWDGKIGCWPCGNKDVAKRASVNRPKGATVWKETSMDTDYYKAMMMGQVVPAIVANWPAAQFNRAGFVVRIQQDNAPSHFAADNEDWVEFLEEMGWSDKIELYNQPPNSPDCNLLDLGFFRALQAVYYRESPKTALEICDMVSKAYAEYDAHKINRIWLSYMACLNAIVEHHGENTYKQPHLNKDKLAKDNGGVLPRVIAVSDAVQAIL